MSFIFKTGDGRSLQLNAWNGRVVPLLVAEAAIVPEEDWELTSTNGVGGEIRAEDVAPIADYLEREILTKMHPGQCVRWDGEVLECRPDPRPIDRIEDPGALYRVRRDVLVLVIEFLRAACGEIKVY